MKIRALPSVPSGHVDSQWCTNRDLRCLWFSDDRVRVEHVA